MATQYNHGLYQVKPVKTGHKLFGQIVGFIIGSFAVALFCGLLYHPINDTLRGMRYEPSNEMAEIMDRLELTDRGLLVFKSTQPVLQNRDEFIESGCNDVHDTTSTLGCYDSTNIYIYNSENSELAGLEESTAAHELLHAIWSRLAFYDTARLEPLLDEVYNQNKDKFADYMADYPDDQHYTELHSVIGTELPASQLPDELRAHYETFFANFDHIYSYYEQYDGVLAKINAEIDALEQEIEQQRAEITKREEYYETEANRLNEDIRRFNQNANTDGYFTSQQEFDRQRNLLISRQKTLSNYYSETSALVDDINQKIEEYNAKAIHHNDLIQSINSKPQNSSKVED